MNIVKSELHKLKKSRAFYICLLVCAAGAVLFILAIHSGIANGDSDGWENGRGSTLDALANFLGMPFLPVVFAVFVPVFTAAGFHSGAVKNYISKGAGRLHWYFSKLAVCLGAVFSMYTVFAVTCCAAGAVLWGFNPDGRAFGAAAVMLLGVGLLFAALTCVFVFFSTWLRGNGASVTVNIGLVLLLPDILLVINYIAGDGIELPENWIMDNLTAVGTLEPADGAPLHAVMVALWYLLGGTALGVILFKKRDI